jgi:hypothetical protein
MRLQLKQMIGALALVAVAAMFVAAAAGASEFKTSKFPVSFKGVGLGLNLFQSENNNLIMCNKSSSTGTLESATLAKVTVTYETCELKAVSPISVSEACPNITTKELDIKPISKLNKGTKTGLLFAAVSGAIAEFTCSGGDKVKVKVTGSVLCESTPIGPPAVTEGKVSCKKKAGVNGEQEFTEGENTQSKTTVKDALTAESTLSIFKVTEKDSQETTEDVTYSAAVEQTA